MDAYKGADEVADKTATSEVREGLCEATDGAVAARGWDTAVVLTPVFKSAPRSVPGTGLLGGRVRRGRFASSIPR